MVMAAVMMDHGSHGSSSGVRWREEERRIYHLQCAGVTSNGSSSSSNASYIFLLNAHHNK